MREYTLIDGNLLDAKADFICHQVNCQGKMGSGVAKAIREQYPQVYEQYITMYNYYYNNGNQDKLLGIAQYVPLFTSTEIDNNTAKQPYMVINIFAQNNYGYDGKQYTSLEALKKCLETINAWAKDRVVAFPWLIGCVRGGADWNVVLPMILETLTDVKEIQFYKL